MKLYSISSTVSEAVHGENISSTEFHKILQVMEKYHYLKEDIWWQSKEKEKKIVKEQNMQIK